MPTVKISWTIYAEENSISLKCSIAGANIFLFQTTEYWKECKTHWKSRTCQSSPGSSQHWKGWMKKSNMAIYMQSLECWAQRQLLGRWDTNFSLGWALNVWGSAAGWTSCSAAGHSKAIASTCLTKPWQDARREESCKPCQGPQQQWAPTADAGAVYKVILGKPGIPAATVHPWLWLLRGCVCWTWPHPPWGFRGWGLLFFTSRADTEPGVLWQQGTAGNGFHLSAPRTHHAREFLQSCRDPPSFSSLSPSVSNAWQTQSYAIMGTIWLFHSQQRAHQSTGVTLNCFYSICFIMLLRLSSDTVLINSIPS